MPRDSTLYTLTDAARQLGLSRQRVHQLVRLMGITPVSVLGRLALTPAQIATLRGRTKGTPGRKPGVKTRRVLHGIQQGLNTSRSR